MYQKTIIAGLMVMILLFATTCSKRGDNPIDPQPPNPEMPLPEQIQSSQLLWRVLLSEVFQSLGSGRGAVLRNGHIEIATASGCFRVDLQNGALADHSSFGSIRGGLANIHTYDRYIVNHEYRLSTLSGTGVGDNIVRVFDMNTLVWLTTYPHVPFSDTVFDRMAGLGDRVYFLLEKQNASPGLSELDFTTGALSEHSGLPDSLYLFNVPDAWEASGERFLCLIAGVADSMAYVIYNATQQKIVTRLNAEKQLPYFLLLGYGGQQNGRIYTRHYASGKLVCRNIADGSIAWERSLSGNNINLLGVSDDRLLLLEDNVLFALNTENGSPVWSKTLEGVFMGHVFMDDKIVVLTLDKLNCLNLGNGQETLNVGGFGLYKTGYPGIVKAEQGLIFIGWEKYLLCFQG